ARSGAEPVVRGLAVDQKPAAIGERVGRASTVAAAFLSHNEQEPDARLAFASEAIGGSNLRRKNALRIPGPPARDPIAFEAARKERRNAVEMRRQHHLRLAGSGQDVEPQLVNWLFEDFEPEFLQVSAQPPPHGGFSTGRRIDIDERTREMQKIDRW